MITALLLLPVLGILVWLYWYLLPGRIWRGADSAILFSVLLAAAGFLALMERTDFTEGGPLWGHIVAAVGTYAILAIGLGAGLAWRRRH